MGNPGKYALNRVNNPFTSELFQMYFETLERTGMYLAAADSVGCSYPETLEYRKAHVEFQEMCEIALERYRNRFIAAAEIRAIDGYQEPIVGGRNRDEIVAHKTIYSDKLMELFLKRTKEGGFIDKKEVTVVGGVEIRQEMDLRSLSKRCRQALRQLLVMIIEDDTKKALGEHIE